MKTYKSNRFFHLFMQKSHVWGYRQCAMAMCCFLCFTGCRNISYIRSYWDSGKKHLLFEEGGYFTLENKFIRHGECKNWNKDGKLVFLSKYSDDVLDRHESFWPESGTYRTRYLYKDGKIQEAFFYDNKGIVIFHELFKNGNGIDYSLYPSGEIEWQVPIKNGKKHGEMIFYDRNGTTLKTYTYRDGKQIKKQEK